MLWCRYWKWLIDGVRKYTEGAHEPAPEVTTIPCVKRYINKCIFTSAVVFFEVTKLAAQSYCMVNKVQVFAFDDDKRTNAVQF